jgi:GT2 family glycosyltransferase
MVLERIDHYPVRLRYIHHQNRGPGYSENCGIRAAQGPWVLLIADDIHPVPSMLQVHYDAHCGHPQAHVAIAGKVVQSPSLPGTVFLKNWDPFGYRKLDHFDELSYLNFWAANVSFKKSFVVAHGMFIERTAAAHEDTELGWRLWRRGDMKLLYRPDALAHHYHVENIDSAIRRWYERGVHFDVLADSIDDPALYIRTHLVTRKTLPLLFRRRNQLVGQVVQEDQSFAWFLLREALRWCVFNRVTIPVITSAIRLAETNRLVALAVTPHLLRGTTSYFFRRGVRDLRRRRAASGAIPLSV